MAFGLTMLLINLVLGFVAGFGQHQSGAANTKLLHRIAP
jgi:hypothetical protein